MAFKIDWGQIATKGIIGLGGLAATLLIFLASFTVSVVNGIKTDIRALNTNLGILHDQNNAQDIKISAHEIEIAFLKADIVQLKCYRP